MAGRVTGGCRGADGLAQDLAADAAGAGSADRGYSCPTQSQAGSAQGPEQSARQCMLIRCPHWHRPRAGREPGLSSLGSDGRR
jgi:hypothetical protein